MNIQAGNTAVLESLQDINQRATDEAIKSWDENGSGCFHVYVSRYVSQVWNNIIRWN